MISGTGWEAFDPVGNLHYDQFIRANTALWAGFPNGAGSNGLLLVEPALHPMLSHANAVFARIIKEARDLRIGWIDTGNPAIQDRLRSYDATSETVRRPGLFGSEERLALATFLNVAARLRSCRDILGLSVDGVALGDIVYDTYLARHQLATIRRIDSGLLTVLWRVIRTYYKCRAIILDANASAVLVSHEVGVSGILMRAALQLGRSVFLRQSSVTLNLKTTMQEIYFNACKPRSVDLKILSGFGESRIEGEFAEIMEARIRLGRDFDAAHAYGTKRVYRSKLELANELGLSRDAPFAFVMLHAFNDHPHSHYGSMLFQDYYRWFKETLAFAQNKPDVNWIFKEHPSSEFYPTKDISLTDDFKLCPSNIVFLNRAADFSSESLIHTADAVVTVGGTAGVEFAAAAGIPAIMAGRCSYTGLGFTIEPASKEEYFSILEHVGTIGRLTQIQQQIARQAFLYGERYAYVPFHWRPEIDYKDQKDQNLEDYFWDAILAIYAEQSKCLMIEFQEYVDQIRKPDFTRLTHLSSGVMSNRCGTQNLIGLQQAAET